MIDATTAGETTAAAETTTAAKKSKFFFCFFFRLKLHVNLQKILLNLPIGLHPCGKLKGIV